MTVHLNRALGPIHDPGFAGVRRLWKGKTVNGQEPSVWLSKLDASAKTLTCKQTGEVLSLASTGSDPTFNEPGPHVGDLALGLVGGKVPQASGGAFGFVGSEDMLLLVALRYSSETAVVVSKFEYTGGNYYGYELLAVAGGTLRFQLGRGTAANYTVDATGLTDGDHVLCMCALDASATGGDGRVIYTNGVQGNSLAAPGASITTAVKLTVGARSDLNLKGTSQPSLVAVWKKAGLFTSKVNMDAIAKQLAALWLGHELLHNDGPTTPTTL